MQLSRFARWRKYNPLLLFLLAPLALWLATSPAVYAISSDDLGSITNNTPFYDPSTSTNSTCGVGSTILVGNDNEQQAFNYFRAKGLSDMQAAAVVGNLMLESHMDPTIMEKGGSSQNPADADPLGWGIAQWTPGSKVTGIAQGLNITGPIYGLATQLDIVWGEMNNAAPTDYKDLVAAFNQTTLSDAVGFFQQNFESGTNFDGRLSFAQQALQQYGGSSTPAGSPTTSSCALSSALSPDCQTAAGSAKILCAAKQYDPVSYSESGDAGHQGGGLWHQSCPTINASCVLDCSGLVNIAVYDAFGADLRENTYTEVSDTQYWKKIPFDQVQAGDLIVPAQYAGGHVEIIDHVQGSTLYTFGAHTNSVPQPDQVGPSAYTTAPGDIYLHYIGPGSS